LIVAIKAGWIGKPVDQLTIDELEKLYVEFHTRAQSDESLNDAGREWFSKLESGDKEARDIWQKCIDVSTREHNKVYELLDVKIDYVHGESFYEDLMPKVIEECKTRGTANRGERLSHSHKKFK
jgi:arginyl-tRNA synthetase